MGQSQKSLKAGDALDIVVHSFIDVPNVSTKVIGYNQSRRYLLIINDSDTVIYIAHSVPAQLNQGIRIEANGGRYECSPAYGNLCEHSMYAIQSKNSTKRLLVTEGS